MRADRTPKVPSPKQVAANQMNAKRSTGPRTAAGRARSRMNALRHGLCARVVLLPGEDRSEYGVFAQQICDELKPKGIVQQMLAGRVAALSWALSRLPRAVQHLVERGEDQRWHAWFTKRGLWNLCWARATYSPDRDKESWAEHPDAHARVGFNETVDQFVDRELEKACADGDPPPERHKAPGVIADAIAGQHGFGAVLKLDDYERRLWSALQSALRSLERRQKLDGCAEDEEEEDAAERPRGAGVSPASSGTTQSEGETPSPRDTPAPCDGEPTVPDSSAADPPLAVSQTEARPGDCETASGDDAGDADSAPLPAPLTATAPARNEPISPDDAAAPGEPQVPPSTKDGSPDPPTDLAPASRAAGAERTHLGDDSPGWLRDENAPDPAPPPPN